MINRSRGLARPLHADWCDSFGAKLRGLAWRRSLGAEEGVVLVNEGESRANSAIHMLGMFFDLAIVWLDGEKSVVDVRVARAWRSILKPRMPAQYVIECAAERLNEFVVGDHIAFETLP